ncbi:MAG: HD domain-containing phosphohydrolase [bacterium]
MDRAHTPPERNSQLEEQIRKLNAIGIALSSEQNLNRLLEVIVKEARSFTNADGGSLYIKEKDRLNFTVAQTESLRKRDSRKEPFKEVCLPMSKESIAGYVAITGNILNINDVYKIPPTVEYRVNKQFDIRNNYRSKSMLVVPMRDHAGSIIGVLQLINSLDEAGNVVPFKLEYESLVHSLASQAAVAIRNVKLIEEIKRLFRSLVRYSARAIDARSPHTAGHSGRVAKYSVRLACAINEEREGRLGKLGFSPDEIEELRMAAWLHDIGKIGVSEAVLEKTNKLTDDQIKVIGQRFESIRQAIRIRYFKKRLRYMRENRNGGRERVELHDACEQEMKEIDDAFEFINHVNIPGFLEAADHARLRLIAERTFVDSRGKRCHFLTPQEYETLSIIKGNLTDSEYKEIQSHVHHTLDILNKIPFTRDLENIPKHAAAHHEYLDGSGYPNGLKGDAISIQARIMCIADIFDALSSPDRPYKKAISIEESIEILRQEVKAGKLDGDIVELFIDKKLYYRPALEEEEEE